KNVAVTAGYVSDAPRAELFEHMDAANVDLKSFSESFYRNVAGGHLEPVLDTLRYLVHRTNVWTEITTLLIPGHNDSDEEITRLSEWVGRELGDDIPIHFSAFHPDYRMRDVPATPATTLTRARAIARGAGLKHVYTGNVHDAEGDTTYCASCGEAVIRRDWYRLLEYRLDHGGHCVGCGAALAGRFEGPPGTWGARRLPIEPQVFAAKR
ncbi:MAG: AmmeMemoRadiSam system radical SAM enzyme, partial [Myxococcales bacterium]|nr:AmmeMemoRadiSam system radical SAM enzyme [Myxococcales bacterium]